MITDILRYFLLKKADGFAIEKILKSEGFIYTPQDVENILKGNQKGVRYGNIVLTRNENGQEQRRFLKVVIDGTFRTFKLFRRQVEITNALHNDVRFDFPTIEVIKYSLNSRVPYALFETRDNGENFGFMHDNELFYEKFTEQDMHNLVSSIYSFHNAGIRMDRSIWKYTQTISSDLRQYKKQIQKDLDTTITHKSADGTVAEKTVKELVESYTGLQDSTGRVLEILEKNWKQVIASRIKNKNYLVHADMQIDNVYKHKDGTFELLDFEWVGGSDNPVTAIMYDYGNLRARAWSSPSFQSLLDNKMLEVGKTYYDDIQIIHAGLTLGILRSSVMMCRFHLDFINTVKKDRRTEEEYQTMYPKTLVALNQIVKSSNP